MAEGETYQKQVEEQLNCPVCLEQYRQPKQLRCHHSFCTECLERIPSEEDRSGCNTLRCPTCREVTPLTDEGILALPSSFLLVNLLEICKRTHRITVTSAENEERWVCTDHKKLLDIYCNDCEVVICHHCSLRSHRDHSYDLIADSWERQLKEICGKLIPLQQQVHYVQVACEALKNFDDKLVKSDEAVKLKINQEADDLIAAVQQSRHQLLEETTKTTQRKRNVICLQKERASDMLAHLMDYKCSVQELIGHGSKLKVLASKAEIIQQLVSASSSIDLPALEPSEVNDLAFHPSSDEEPFQGLGLLTSTHLIDKCCVTGEGIRVAYCNKPASFEVSVANEESVPYSILHSLVSCQATANGNKVACTVSQSDSNTYEV